MAPNSLIHEKSPYLLQHALNPVDWHAWSEDAFEKAVSENKPVFLSIGYATCHWCHVMEKESFEDSEVAEQINQCFVPIKVDREERPDIDVLYMAACQILTGHGGWPLTILLTPQKEPFFAATYLPKLSQFGRPGLLELCQKIHDLWHHQKTDFSRSSKTIIESMSQFFSFQSGTLPGTGILKDTYAQFENAFDSQFGGFDKAPKFPMPSRLSFLLQYHRQFQNKRALDMVIETLTAMRRGGLWDHVGFGFHRYATDRRWLLPHFEKMLYDQALLALAYLEAFDITQDRFFADTATEIFTYVLRDMTAEEGGFYSAEDADSEGEEGKFYVWTLAEFKKALAGHTPDMWTEIFQIEPGGNFNEESTGRAMGTNIPHLTMALRHWGKKFDTTEADLADRWEMARERLFQTRQHRVPPLKDDKILTDWNGLMIAALAKGALVLNHSPYKDAAEKAADFILTQMKAPDGRLYHRYRAGDAGIEAMAGDYAYVIAGLLSLFDLTGKDRYRHTAELLQEQMLADFWDDEQGGFFFTRHTELPVRPKELYDGAMPSANSVALNNLIKLHKLTSNEKWGKKAEELINAFSGSAASQPTAYTSFLTGILLKQ